MQLTRNKTGARGLLAVLAAVTAVGVAACGSSSASPAQSSSAPGSSATARQTAGGQVVTITGNSALRFMPMTVHVHTGRVRIVLKDSGAYPHNIVIPRLGRTSATVTGSPGETQKIFIVNFPRPGRYEFRCQYHAGEGMTGVFVVS